MEDKKKKKNIFLRILFIIFIVYFSLFLMDSLGYYNIASKNKILTDEKIKEFESDVKNGQKIDIKNYVSDNTNYKNIYSKFGYSLSTGIDDILNKGFKTLGKYLKKIFQ